MGQDGDGSPIARNWCLTFSTLPRAPMNGLYQQAPSLPCWTQGKVPARVGWSGVGRRKRLEHVFLWVPFCWARLGSDLFLSQRPGPRSSSLLRAVGLTSLCSGFSLPTLLGQGCFNSAPCLPHTLTHGPSCLQCTLRLHATPPTLPAALASDCVWQVVDPFHSCLNQNSPTLCWSGGLGSKGRNASTRRNNKDSTELEVEAAIQTFWVLLPLNQQAKEGFAVQAGMKLNCHYTVDVRKNMSGTWVTPWGVS